MHQRADAEASICSASPSIELAEQPVQESLPGACTLGQLSDPWPNWRLCLTLASSIWLSLSPHPVSRLPPPHHPSRALGRVSKLQLELF